MSTANQLHLDNLKILQLDVTNLDQINELKESIYKQYETIDILINNAGYSVGGMTEHVSLQEWREQLDTNLFGVIAVTKAFLPLMRKKRGGKIINLGSISGRFGFPGLGPYVTSKFALSGFSESLRLELLPFHIYVSLIEAGSFKTDIWEKALSNNHFADENDYTPYLKKIYQAAEQSAKNAADPKEVIQVIQKICSSNKPKFRYQVGKGVRSLVILKNLLPWSFAERMIIKQIYRSEQKKR